MTVQSATSDNAQTVHFAAPTLARFSPKTCEALSVSRVRDRTPGRVRRCPVLLMRTDQNASSPQDFLNQAVCRLAGQQAVRVNVPGKRPHQPIPPGFEHRRAVLLEPLHCVICHGNRRAAVQQDTGQRPAALPNQRLVQGCPVVVVSVVYVEVVSRQEFTGNIQERVIGRFSVLRSPLVVVAPDIPGDPVQQGPPFLVHLVDVRLARLDTTADLLGRCAPMEKPHIPIRARRRAFLLLMVQDPDNLTTIQRPDKYQEAQSQRPSCGQDQYVFHRIILSSKGTPLAGGHWPSSGERGQSVR